MTFRRRRAVEWALLGATSACLAALGLCLALLLAAGEPRVPGVGNGTDGVLAASAPESAYRVVVFGDTQKGVTGLKRLIDATRPDRPAFYVHTGDLVSNNDEGHYRWALTALRRARLEAPFFVAPGNHDVKRSPALFERHFERLEFSFARGGVQFVSIDNALGTPPDAAGVDARLEAAGGRPVVLFLHQPVFDSLKDGFEVRDKYAALMEVVKRHRVKYMISGHAHGYRRVEHAGIVHVVNGVGGDSDAWQFDAPVCATVLEVNGEAVTDRKVELPAELSLWDNVEHLALAEMGNAWSRDTAVMVVASAVLVAGWGFALARIVRRPGRAKHDAVGAGFL